MKVAINTDFGMFGLSLEAATLLGIQKPACFNNYFVENADFGITDENYLAYRAAPKLIEVIEEIGGERASGPYAHLKIVEAEPGWTIGECDGLEYIRERGENDD